MNPGHGAPNRSAPAACIRARSCPNPPAAAASAAPACTQETTSVDSSQPITSGTGTAAASPSQRRLWASARSAPPRPAPATLTNAFRPSASAAR